jgi:hypothetical protein
MRATLNGHQVVDVLEVGRLSSRVRYRRGQDGDTVTMWARNLELDPEPCGACLGKGCKACEGRGHSPQEEPSRQEPGGGRREVGPGGRRARRLRCGRPSSHGPHPSVPRRSNATSSTLGSARSARSSCTRESAREARLPVLRRRHAERARRPCLSRHLRRLRPGTRSRRRRRVPGCVVPPHGPGSPPQGGGLSVGAFFALTPLAR